MSHGLAIRSGKVKSQKEADVEPTPTQPTFMERAKALIEQGRAWLESASQRIQPSLIRLQTWFQGLSRNGKIGVGCGTLIVACVVCSVGAAALGAGGSATTAHGSTATLGPTATPQPLSTLTATATPHFAFDTAVLGASETIFLRFYQTSGSLAGTVRDYTATISSQHVLIIGSFAISPDSHLFGYIGLRPQSTNQTWDQTTADKVAQAFIPSDAKFVQDMQAPDLGLEHIYVSADLALVFPASVFTNAQNGQPVPPGTFYVSCHNQVDPRGGCSLQLGE